MNNLHFPSTGQKPIDLPFLNAPSKSLQMIINGNQPQFFGSYQPGAGTYTPANPLGGLPVMGQPAQQSSASSRINEILKAMQAGAGATKTPQMSVQQLNQRDQYQADLRTAASFAPRMDQAGTLRDRGGFLATSDYVGPSAEEIAQMRRFGIGLPALRNSLGLINRAEAAGVAGYNELMEFKRNEGYGPVLRKHFSDMQSRARAATEAQIKATGTLAPPETPEQRVASYVRSIGGQMLGDKDVSYAGGKFITPRTRMEMSAKPYANRYDDMSDSLAAYYRMIDEGEENFNADDYATYLGQDVVDKIRSGDFQREMSYVKSERDSRLNQARMRGPEVYLGRKGQVKKK